MSAYTDDDVQAAIAAIQKHRDFSEKWADDTALCIATDVLPAVASAIAARALREAADAIAGADESCRVKKTCHYADSITLRARADGIEAAS